MLSRLFIILLFVPFLLWIFLKGNVMFLVFTLVIIGMSLFEFYKMLKDKGFEVASRIGMGLGLFLPIAIYFQENSKCDGRNFLHFIWNNLCFIFIFTYFTNKV